jgi:hypothetical protein
MGFGKVNVSRRASYPNFTDRLQMTQPPVRFPAVLRPLSNVPILSMRKRSDVSFRAGSPGKTVQRGSYPAALLCVSRLHGHFPTVRAIVLSAVIAIALSGCGVFCGAAGGSGGSFGAGCATGMRF